MSILKTLSAILERNRTARVAEVYIESKAFEAGTEFGYLYLAQQAEKELIASAPVARPVYNDDMPASDRRSAA